MVAGGVELKVTFSSGRWPDHPRMGTPGLAHGAPRGQRPRGSRQSEQRYEQANRELKREFVERISLCQRLLPRPAAPVDDLLSLKYSPASGEDRERAGGACAWPISLRHSPASGEDRDPPGRILLAAAPAGK